MKVATTISTLCAVIPKVRILILRPRQKVVHQNINVLKILWNMMKCCLAINWSIMTQIYETYASDRNVKNSWREWGIDYCCPYKLLWSSNSKKICSSMQIRLELLRNRICYNGWKMDHGQNKWHTILVDLDVDFLSFFLRPIPFSIASFF